jgi:hypothetical protein
MSKTINNIAEAVARIMELENDNLELIGQAQDKERQLELTREAIKPFRDYIQARAAWPDSTPIVVTDEAIMRPITAKDFRRLAACGSGEL